MPVWLCNANANENFKSYRNLTILHMWSAYMLNVQTDRISKTYNAFIKEYILFILNC